MLPGNVYVSVTDVTVMAVATDICTSVQVAAMKVKEVANPL
jgi:hypothetical protein